ncbi:hypothetical protein Tco_0475586 [Tanacetum coccineum]
MKNPKKAKKPAMKSTIVPTVGVVIRDTPGVFVSKKKAPAKGDRGDRVGSQPKVLDESQDKTTGTNEGTGTKPRLPNVSKDHSESENESWGDSKDDDRNDDVSKGDDDDADSDGDGDNDASDNEKETQDDEYIHTSDSYASIDEETNDDYREFDEEEYDELYKDVNMTLNVVENKKEGEGDADMTDAAQEDVSQENKFLNLDNVPPADNEVTSMMNVKVSHEESSIQAPPLLTIHVMAIPITSTVAATSVPSTITLITPIPQMSTPTPVPTTEPTTSSIPVLPDFASLFRFDQRVTINEPLENVVLAKSSSQPQSTYEAATSLTKFELKKILLDKLEKSKSYRAVEQHKRPLRCTSQILSAQQRSL